MQKRYSIGFYTGGGSIEEWNRLSKEEKKLKLKKHWYVWWSYRNPETGLMERQEPNIKEGINIHKTKAARLKAMKVVKKEMEDLLDTGYSPYDNPKIIEKTTIADAFSMALDEKRKEVTETTYVDYNSRINKFKEHLTKKGYLYIDEVNKSVVSSFLSNYKGKTSNNYKVVIGSIFSVLSDHGVVELNFIKELRNKKVRKKPQKIFSKKYIDNVTNKLIDQDKTLLMYVHLISYMFWRPIEVVRINIKDIDIRNRTMTVDTKSKDGKTKIIPSIIMEELVSYIGEKNGMLFELGAEMDRDKRTYLTNRFKNFRERNKFDKELTPYAFRHSNITMLYIKLRETMNKKSAIEELSLITGHDSKAIWNYIHVNDIELPQDYSELLK